MSDRTNGATSGEVGGVVIGGICLAGFAGAVVMIATRALDAVLAELLAAIMPGLGIVAAGVIIVGLAAARATSRRGGELAARFDAGRDLSPALRKKIEAHENDHLAKARQFGANGWWQFDRDGASFYLTNASHLTPVQRAAIALAPHRGSWWSAADHDGWDEQWAKQCIDRLPRDERDAAWRQARKLAR